jgi:hypothetical protein
MEQLILPASLFLLFFPKICSEPHYVLRRKPGGAACLASERTAKSLLFSLMFSAVFITNSKP